MILGYTCYKKVVYRPVIRGHAYIIRILSMKTASAVEIM